MNGDKNYIEYLIPRDDTVYVTEFCNVNLSSQLLAVGTDSKVSIYQCKFREEDEDVDDFKYNHLYDFHNETRVTAVAWSPDTSLSIPKHVRLAVAGNDRQIKVFSTDLKSASPVKPMGERQGIYCSSCTNFYSSIRADEWNWQPLIRIDLHICDGHSNFINSVTFHPHRGDQLASTGDDKCCRIWDKNGNQESCFHLSAAGMSVCWHPDEELKILVAQKNGVIKMFSLSGQHQLMSYDTGQTPLMEADWSLGNDGLLIGAVAGSYFFIFDISVLSRPVDKQQMHVEGARYCRWAKCNDSLVATGGRPGRQIKVFNVKHQQNPIVIPQSISYGLSWHQNLPILASGGDKKIHLYVFDYM